MPFQSGKYPRQQLAWGRSQRGKSQRGKSQRGSSLVSSALAVVVTTVGVGAVPARAAPEPSADDVAGQLRDLSREAENLTEDFKKAQDDRAARRADLDRAEAEAGEAEQRVDAANAEQERFRGRVDRFTGATYKGARLSRLSALLSSRSPTDYLDRASTLDILAKDNNDAVRSLESATRQARSSAQQAHSARGRATAAEAEAARIEGELGGKKAAMDGRIAQVKQTYESLSSQQKKAWSGSGSDAGPIGGSGAAVEAVNAALGKQGSPYVWGAKGPSQFDCSGLVQYAYQQAGVSLPAATKSQVSIGKGVSESEMKPGDVLFFYGSASHNGIYVGNGKVVHAPTEGQDVKVENYEYIGNVHSVRRVAG